MLALHAIALVSMFVPVAGNNNFRKLFASVVLVVWAVSFVGWAFGIATLPAHLMVLLTLMIGAVLGKLWDVETQRMAEGWGISVTHHDDDDE